MVMPWELAQINIGRLLAPTDAPETAGFMNALEPINALAGPLELRVIPGPTGADGPAVVCLS